MTKGHGGGTQLLLGSEKAIGDLNGGWASVDDPPTVVVSDTRYDGLVIVDLRTLRRRMIRLPSDQVVNVLAAWRAPTSLQIAYEENGPCNPPQGLDSMLIPGNDNNQYRPHNLCIVKVPDGVQLSQRLAASRPR